MMPMWPPAGKLDVFQVVDPVLFQSSSCRGHDEITLQPQAIIPCPLLAPADQGAVEAHQPDPLGQPGDDRVEQRLLGVEPDRASATRHASGKARSPQRSASIST
jgi:hypothetical protein